MRTGGTDPLRARGCGRRSGPLGEPRDENIAGQLDPPCRRIPTCNLQRSTCQRPTFNLQPAAPLTKNLNAALTNADCAVVGTKHRPYRGC